MSHLIKHLYGWLLLPVDSITLLGLSSGKSLLESGMLQSSEDGAFPWSPPFGGELLP